ncbi:(Fe-S)-binding protein [Helicobacter marmotae]|uniref:(Fe-S)-binding protein n=1 Tax=Helicobacter marmotae TaxID=152490 RepID=A0A3D8I7C0_9HELI|nr:(Fe-S)-binding protein [Helicobacter marmotae]RDU61038.1 (Fe-S)-binding protein [Helicobacter marmotae]
MRVFFFSTCLGGVAYADTCVNAIKLLQKEGCEVVFKKDQTCCAQPTYNSGYYEQSRKVALHNIELFSGEEPIIVPSGSCVGMMREDYVELFEGTSDFERAKQFSSRIYDLGEYLHKVLKVKYEDKGNPTKVTWHSNCHALRTAKVINSAKALISSLSNVELVELEREAECCGFGGTFSIKEPEVSNAMVNQKIQDILSRDVEYVISADAGCLLNISGAMKKQKLNVKPIHLYDFLAQRIGLGA